jgi:hypothetical protein
MKFTTLQPGEDLAKLTRRLFPTRSRNVRQAAQEALLSANPHLADPKELPEGAPVVIPDVPGARPAAGETGSAGEVLLSLLRQARDQIGDLRPVLDARIDRQEEESKAAQALASAPDLRKLAEREPEVKKRLSTIAQNNRAELERLQSFRKLQHEAIAQIQEDLDKFLAAGFKPGRDNE